MKEVSWLAGLLEGEGCFRYANGCPTIQLSMTDRDVVERAAKLIGIKAHAPYKRDDGHRWVHTCMAFGTDATGWMMTVYSFMGERRRKKIRDILAQWKASSRIPRAPAGKRFTATCHPDRMRAARGLCFPCYMREWKLAKKHNMTLERFYGETFNGRTT
jgi:hypothetical protein